MSNLTPLGGGPLTLGASADAPAPTQSCDTAAIAPAVAAAAAPASAAGDHYINPHFSVDPQSGVVILQYRDAAGKILRQVPSQYELRSYQPAHEPTKSTAPA